LLPGPGVDAAHQGRALAGEPLLGLALGVERLARDVRPPALETRAKSPV
jgi:hypothetical protein